MATEKRLRISDGAGMAVGHKGKNEDRLAKVGIERKCGQVLDFYSIFDGHGGKEAAEMCVHELHGRVSDNLNEEKDLKAAVAKAFWDLDDALGTAGINAGTTATCLIISSETHGRPKKASIAWVGDSIGVCFDMLALKTKFTTTRHNPDVESEMRKLRAIWQLRKKAQRSGRRLLAQAKKFEPLDNSSSGQTVSVEECRSPQHCHSHNSIPSPQGSEDSSSPWDPDYAPPSDRPGLAEDILFREHKINESMRNLQRADHDELERQDTDVGPRALCPKTGNPLGPLVVRSAWSIRGGKRITGASTTVSRSIGDWDAGRAVIPEPDFFSWDLPSLETTTQYYDRILLASDGLWDVITPRKVERILAGFIDPQAAADELMRAAKTNSIKYGYGTYKDDTALIVVDIKADGSLATVTASTPCTCALS